jgi:hypothetical protein
MRVFVSYSFSDRDLYVISLLASQLQENGDTVLTSNGTYKPGSSQEKVVQSQIRSSIFFIGIITQTGSYSETSSQSRGKSYEPSGTGGWYQRQLNLGYEYQTPNDRVYSEWLFAQQSGIPGLLLIEEGTFKQVDGPDIFRFNRHDPRTAVQAIKDRVQKSTDRVNQWRAPVQNVESINGNALAWILGGFAALLALKLLTQDAK